MADVQNDSTSRSTHDFVSDGKEIPYVNSGHHNWYKRMNVYQHTNRSCAEIIKTYEMAKIHTIRTLHKRQCSSSRPSRLIPQARVLRTHWRLGRTQSHSGLSVSRKNHLPQAGNESRLLGRGVRSLDTFDRGKLRTTERGHHCARHFWYAEMKYGTMETNFDIHTLLVAYYRSATACIWLLSSLPQFYQHDLNKVTSRITVGARSEHINRYFFILIFDFLF
jgi:hypothetical protein